MWRVIPGQELHYREWDDEFVLYNNLSGDTHLLGVSAIHLLHALQSSAGNGGDLTAALCASLEMEQSDEVESDVQTLLKDLQSLSLVEYVS